VSIASIFTACSKPKSRVSVIETRSLPEGKIILDTNRQSFYLETEAEYPLGSLLHYQQLSKDTSIFVQASPKQIFLFVNNKFNKTIGRYGKGPGEYTNINSFCQYGDTLFVFNRNRKTLGYLMSNGMCVYEMTDKKMLFATEMQRISKGRSIFVNNFFEPESDDKEEFIYTIADKTGVKDSYPIERGMIQYPKTNPPIVGGTCNPLKVHDRIALLIFSFSPYLVMMNTEDKEAKLIKLQVSIKYPSKKPNLEIPEESTTKEVIENSDAVLDVFPLSAMFAVVVLKTSYSKLRQGRIEIQFYSYDGKSLGVVEFPRKEELGLFPRIVNIDETTILAIGFDPNKPNSPYKLTQQTYAWAKK
jgi:hypothetical protein